MLGIPLGTLISGWSQTVAQVTELSAGVTVACFDASTAGPTFSLPGVPDGLSALEQRLWLARPDLRHRISPDTARRAALPPSPSYLLPLPPCGLGVGLRVDDAVAMGIWSDAADDWSWWWSNADVVPASSFRLQLRPDLTDDAFLNGTVRTIDGDVSTPAGSYTDAVIVDYVVELGECRQVEAFFQHCGSQVAAVCRFLPAEADRL